MVSLVHAHRVSIVTIQALHLTRHRETVVCCGHSSLVHEARHPGREWSLQMNQQVTCRCDNPPSYPWSGIRLYQGWPVEPAVADSAFVEHVKAVLAVALLWQALGHAIAYVHWHHSPGQVPCCRQCPADRGATGLPGSGWEPNYATRCPSRRKSVKTCSRRPQTNPSWAFYPLNWFDAFRSNSSYSIRTYFNDFGNYEHFGWCRWKSD